MKFVGDRKLKQFALIFIAIVSILAASSFLMVRDAFACSCSFQTDPRKAYETADAVFSGVVINLKQEVFEEGGIFEYRDAVLIKVKQTWKGVTDSETIIRTYGGGSSACGYEFKVGESYLIYANENPNLNILETSICSLTKPISNASHELEQLGQGRDPSKNVNLNATFDNMTYKNMFVYGTSIFIRITKYHIALAVGGIVIVAVGILLIKKRRK